ncbi:MAG: hypothetical protein NVS9B3_15030 [Gemmatimonadaceae bacterium]
MSTFFQVSRRLTRAAIVLAIPRAGACRDRGLDRPDAAVVSAGDLARDTVVTARTYPALNYAVTPDRYNRWSTAQRSLDALPIAELTPRLPLRETSDADVDRAVAYVERNSDARRAVDRSGLSARDYVLTSLALSQALAETRDGGVRFSDIPRENLDLVTTRRDDVSRYQRSRYRIVEDDRREDRDDHHLRNGRRHHDDDDDEDEDSDHHEGRRRERD